MTHLFERYFKKHHHYPRVRVPNGVQQLTVEFHVGYVMVSTSPPFQGKVYITRSAWFKMLKEVIPLSKVSKSNPVRDWDVPEKVHAYHLEELALSRELRRQKKERQGDPEARERQRQRFLRARARAAGKRQAQT